MFKAGLFFYLLCLSLVLFNVPSFGQEVQFGIYKTSSGISIDAIPSQTITVPGGANTTLSFTIRYPESFGNITFTRISGLNLSTSGEHIANNYIYRTLTILPTPYSFPSAWNTKISIYEFNVSGSSIKPEDFELIQDEVVTDVMYGEMSFALNSVDYTPISAPFIQSKIPNSLPVELITFSAKPTATATILNWATASEFNNKGFEVMKRLEGEAEFKKIGFVSGIGTSTQIETYKFEDKQLFSGTAYYMLRQIDFDNTASNSQIVAVNNRQKGQLFLSIYPNPATSQVRFSAASETNSFIVSLYSADGKLVLTKEVKNGEDLPVGHLPQGLYQAVYTTETGEKGSGKLIIQK
jgi:hypothetical protein